MYQFMSQTPDIFQVDYQKDSFSAFRSIRHLKHPVLLESGRGRYLDLMGRFDIISAEPFEVIESSPELQGAELLEAVNQRLATLNIEPETIASNHQALPFVGGAIGFLSYDFGQQLEQLPDTAIQDITLPTAWFGIFGWALITDHQQKTSWLVHDPTLSKHSASDLMDFFETATDTASKPFKLTSVFTSNLSQDEYTQRFKRLQSYIQAGDCYQVNFAQRFSAECEGDSFKAFEKIAKKIPTPFSAYFELGQWDILSHSPERFLELDNNTVVTKPIKGTRARGLDPDSDLLLMNELANSTKDKAENLMIVDLLRNDLSRVCAPFSVKVPALFEIESYPNVHHLVSTVQGELADGETATRLLAHSFPGGSITGAPKIRAMEIVDELEPHHRSLYCGSIIYISRHGRMDSSITIRTLVREQNKIYAWGGGGIVSDSNAEEEYQETLTKITPLLKALETH
jgi:para-aminobenzoate synthetase component 1